MRWALTWNMLHTALYLDTMPSEGCRATPFEPFLEELELLARNLATRDPIIARAEIAQLTHGLPEVKA